MENTAYKCKKCGKETEFLIALQGEGDLSDAQDLCEECLIEWIDNHMRAGPPSGTDMEHD